NSTYPNGVYGRSVKGGPCTAVDPLVLDRHIIPHQPNQKLRVVNLSSNTHWRPHAIFVRPGSAPVRVIYLAANGVTWYFANLTQNTFWTLNPPVGPGTGGLKAWVTAEPGGSGAEIDIDDLVIDYTFD